MIYQIKLHGQQEWQEIDGSTPIETLTSDRPIYGIARNSWGTSVPFVIFVSGSRWVGLPYRDSLYAELELECKKRELEGRLCH